MNKDFVILIDGDNVNFTYFQPILDRISAEGDTIKSVHLFGKLSSKYIQDWKAFFSMWNFIEQYPVCENHKNATDIQMIALIYKLYYEEHHKYFVILSSDSDFSYVLTKMPEDSEFLVGYCRDKVSDSYIEFLNHSRFQSVDLDELRGPINQKLMTDIVNTVLQAYLEFKLSSDFFSYATILSWICNRYGYIGLDTAEDVVKCCKNKMLLFEPDGVKVQLYNE